MSDFTTIAAEPRARAGKGTARRARRQGRVPGVIYGGGEPPVTISVESRNFEKLLRTPAFYAQLFDVQVEGGTFRVLARDVQFHPVNGQAIHFDLLRVTPDTRVTVEIPCAFVNSEKSPGIKKGGVLNTVRRSIAVNCLARDIPTTVTIDLAGVDIGQSIHISAVALPEGVKPTILDRNFTIASIAAPTGLKSEQAEAAATPAAS